MTHLSDFDRAIERLHEEGSTDRTIIAIHDASKSRIDNEKVLDELAWRIYGEMMDWPFYNIPAMIRDILRTNAFHDYVCSI